jgi:uncharacterized protein (TIGR03435 family)
MLGTPSPSTYRLRRGTRLACVLMLACKGVIGQQTSSVSEFEVAAIHPSSMMSENVPIPITNVVGSRFMILNCSVARWIGVAFDVSDKRVAGPEWIFSDKYDLSAKLPSGSGKKEVPVMLQSLLAGRFALRVHKEVRRERAWALTVTDASKLGPFLTTGLTVDGPSFPFKSVKPGLVEVVCRACTLAHLADYLSSYIGEVVVDTSGLVGSYEIPLTRRTVELANRYAMGADGLDTLPPSIDESLHRVGLKLERRAVPVQHIVVDSIDHPTAN